MKDIKTNDEEHAQEQKAPILGSWRKLYGLVFFLLIVYMILFYLLTHWLS